MVGTRTALQYCRTLACSRASVGLFIERLPATDRSHPSTPSDAQTPPPLPPSPRLTPLLQGGGAAHRSGLLLQHVQVMFEIQNLMTPSRASLMTCTASAQVTDVDPRRPHHRPHPLPWR